MNVIFCDAKVAARKKKQHAGRETCVNTTVYGDEMTAMVRIEVNGTGRKLNERGIFVMSFCHSFILL